MAFCDHCDGQRYDRAQILRTLRAMRLKMRESDASGDAERVIELAIETVGVRWATSRCDDARTVTLTIPHTMTAENKYE